MNRFQAVPLSIEGVFLLKSSLSSDQRGGFRRVFCAEDLKNFGWNASISQVNISYTKHAGTVRGMHMQNPPYSELKIVQCIRGEIYDVCIDMRAGSPTFLSHCAVRLSSQDANAILIPRGVAHGFQALSNNVEVLYFHSEAYHPDYEVGFCVVDPAFNIRWPEPVTNLSPRDSGYQLIPDNYAGIFL
jgi:dTDP-4-dehydrorhamnose 3,5-epimerase